MSMGRHNPTGGGGMVRAPVSALSGGQLPLTVGSCPLTGVLVNVASSAISGTLSHGGVTRDNFRALAHVVFPGCG